MFDFQRAIAVFMPGGMESAASPTTQRASPAFNLVMWSSVASRVASSPAMAKIFGGRGCILETGKLRYLLDIK